MIELVFVTGGNYRKVYINNRKISMLTAETGFIPISIDLDKLDKKIEKKLGKEEIGLLKEIALLNSEEEMARDITKDFQSTGWRLIKKI